MNPDTLSLCETLGERKALLERFGGLPETTVQNTEWLYILEQDTRHSLAIEGYFASEEELEAVLQGKRSNLEVTNYFRTAQTVYDQALQYYRDKDLRLDLSLVRHIHSELFRGKNDQRGQFRRGSIQILHADVKPPEFDIESYLRTALEVMKKDLNAMPILPALARAHTLFESIHPFSDGNGRTGRILLNYLAISQGYPPIVIKGISSSEREQYYAALEAADTGFHKGFPEAATVVALKQRLQEGDVQPLTALLCDGILPRLNQLIIIALEQREPLLELPEVAARLGVKETALRKRIERRTLLAVKRGKRLYSHPLLAL